MEHPNSPSPASTSAPHPPAGRPAEPACPPPPQGDATASKVLADGITFDDVLLVPRRSAVLPSDADTSSRVTRSIRLNIPLLSAPMDTVTESALAIALAQEGGIGIIHKNMSLEAQALEVGKVKRSENGIIADPVTLHPDQPISDALELMLEQGVSGFPVTVDGGARSKLVGILTRRDMKFLGERRPGYHPHAGHSGNGRSGSSTSAVTRVGDVMTREHLVTGAPNTTLDQARQIISRAKVEKLLLVDAEGNLRGMITMRDIENLTTHPAACRDERGRLLVGAAVGVGQFERVAALVEAEVDLITVDTAHGHSENVLNSVHEIRRMHPELQIIAGNIATEEAARDLIEAGVDAVKVGIGPGSICTTRVVTGVGVPQITAIMNACRAADPVGIPVIADGGIRSSGDISKAIAAGASCVMMGGLFGGLDESPGEVVIRRGRQFKTYRGMGSVGAMKEGSADRYSQSSGVATPKYVPEGVEGLVPYRGKLADFVYQMVGGLRSAMGYCGCRTIEDLRRDTRFVRVTNASVIEGHAHDITITHESPNYTVTVRGDGGE